MKLIENELIKEKAGLEKILHEARKRIKNAPKGRMYTNKKDSHVEYYLQDETKKNGKYIKKENIGIAKRIAQRDYDIKLIKKLEERIRAIEIFLKKYDKTDVFAVYEKTKECRRELLDSTILSNEEYVRRWESVKY